MRTMRKGQASKAGLQELCDYLPGTNLVMAEIGSFSGESAEIFLNSGKFSKIYCVDHWPDCATDHLEAEKEFDLKFTGSPLIVKMKMESGVGASQFEDGTLDFVYIDANHAYEFISRDIDLWVGKIKPDGFIGGHDFSHSFPSVIQAVGERFGKPRHVFWDGSWIVPVSLRLKPEAARD